MASSTSTLRAFYKDNIFIIIITWFFIQMNTDVLYLHNTFNMLITWFLILMQCSPWFVSERFCLKPRHHNHHDVVLMINTQFREKDFFLVCKTVWNRWHAHQQFNNTFITLNSLHKTSVVTLMLIIKNKIAWIFFAVMFYYGNCFSPYLLFCQLVLLLLKIILCIWLRYGKKNV